MQTLLSYLQERKYWGSEAVGSIIVALSNSSPKILFLKRSPDEDSEQGQWEICVGGKKDDEDLDIVAARDREVEEELGVTFNVIHSRQLEIFYDTGDDHKRFQYYVFIKVVPEIFTPNLSDEHTEYKWIDIKNEVIPSPLHFGTERLLNHPDAQFYFIGDMFNNA